MYVDWEQNWKMNEMSVGQTGFWVEYQHDQIDPGQNEESLIKMKKDKTATNEIL